MKIEITDLPEIAVWSKKNFFMKLFFLEHEKQPLDSVVSICESYEKTEILFVKMFGAKAYRNPETFLRTYYYFLNQKQPKPRI